MYDFLGGADFYEDKPIGEWGQAEFRAIFESVQRVFGADIAWQLLFRLIQLRAGEIGEVEFNHNGGYHNLLDEIVESYPEEDLTELTEEEIEELFGEDFDDEDFDDDDDEPFNGYDDGDDGDDYRDRFGNTGRFF